MKKCFTKRDYASARDMAMEHGRISANMLSVTVGVGYKKANLILLELAKNGVIKRSPAGGGYLLCGSLLGKKSKVIRPGWGSLQFGAAEKRKAGK